MKKHSLFVMLLLLVSCIKGQVKIPELKKNALTTPAIASTYTPDPLKNFVTLLIQGTGTNGSTAIANYVDGSALSANDLLAIDTSLYATGAMNFDGIEATLTGIPQAAVEIGLNSFCFEAFITAPVTGNDFYEIVFDTSGNGSGSGGFFVELSTLRGFVFATEFVGLGTAPYPTDGLEHHYMISRDNAGNTLMGIDGVIVTTGVMANYISAQAAGGTIGNYTGATNIGTAQAFQGNIRGVRLTIGDQRYTGNYTVPNFPLDY